MARNLGEILRDCQANRERLTQNAILGVGRSGVVPPPHEVIKNCETCKEPQYAIAGSEDVNGQFQEWLCLNARCPRYMESVRE